MIKPIGEMVIKNHKHGGGSYTVIDHINCERCKSIIELREVGSPSNAQRKANGYYSEYAWCGWCGLYQPNLKTRVTKK